MKKSSQDQSISQDSKCPHFLRVSERDRGLSVGKLTEVDMLIAQGKTDLSALDLAKGRPSSKNKAYKKAIRAVDEVEEYVDFLSKKAGSPLGELGETK